MALKIKFTYVGAKSQTSEATSSELSVSSDINKSMEVSLFSDKSKMNLTLKSGNELKNYDLSLQNIKFRKKMYQPSEISADVIITPATNKTTNVTEPWNPVPKVDVLDLFMNKRVDLYDAGADLKGTYPLGEYFYVQEVEPCYKKSSMVVSLKIYSRDKLMTMEKTSRTFVKKTFLDGIVEKEISKYCLPEDNNNPLTVDTKGAKVLRYWKESNTTIKEHLFPYLVQYNESLYDFLARTANRWGEFMYYENGQLNFGYSGQLGIYRQDMSGKFESMSYVNLDESISYGDHYATPAANDKNFLENYMRKSPYDTRNELMSSVKPKKKPWDKIAMRKMSSFYRNDRNLPTFIFGQAFDDAYRLAVKELEVSRSNNKNDETYFKEADIKNMPERYGNHEFGVKDDEEKSDVGYAFNLFSEIDSDYTNKKYTGILKNEQAAAKDAVCINFDTTCPHLKLGEIIRIYDKQYIVVDVECTSRFPLKVVDGMVVQNDVNPELVYQVIATASCPENAIFYPTIIPTGHFRYSEPQMAKVKKANDPLKKGRVRLIFPWQDEKNDDPSPWVQFASNASGQNGIIGKHYEGDSVFVGFLDGNVERPYVMGALSKGAGSDIVCQSPGGQKLSIGDGGGGATTFVTSALLPGVSTYSDFFPGLQGLDFLKNVKENISLAGGFQLTDTYGIYNISGSTDGRSVNISSPWGNVGINAFTGITISAPNGDISIKGKNVSIEAGNNLSLVSGTNVKYKLFNTKDTVGGTFSQMGLDIAAMVAKKLAQKAIKVVDLSFVRSMIEVVHRPVEGALTVKSNRFLKLEAGKAKCSYPAAAYNNSKLEAVNTENKNVILGIAGAKRTKAGMIKGIKELIQDVRPLMDGFDAKYRESYRQCVLKRESIGQTLNDLKDNWRNSSAGSVTTKTVQELYEQDWKSKMWDVNLAKPYKFTDADFNFTDEVKIEGNPADIVSNALHNLVYARKFWRESSVDKKIVENRKKLRQEAVNKLNDLSKAVFDLLNIEYKKEDVAKHLSWFSFTAVPENFKMMMVKSVSKGKCKDFFYFKAIEGDAQKLENADNCPEPTPGEKKAMRRIVVANLIKEMGIKCDKEFKYEDATDDAKWNNSAPGAKSFVTSIDGISALGRDKTTFGKAFGGLADDLKKSLLFWQGLGENSSWSEGKNGQILFASDKNTYSLDGKAINEVVGLPAIKTLKAANFEGDDKDKVLDFINSVQEELRKY